MVVGAGSVPMHSSVHLSVHRRVHRKSRRIAPVSPQCPFVILHSCAYIGQTNAHLTNKRTLTKLLFRGVVFCYLMGIFLCRSSGHSGMRIWIESGVYSMGRGYRQ